MSNANTLNVIPISKITYYLLMYCKNIFFIARHFISTCLLIIYSIPYTKVIHFYSTGWFPIFFFTFDLNCIVSLLAYDVIRIFKTQISVQWYWFRNFLCCTFTQIRLLLHTIIFVDQESLHQNNSKENKLVTAIFFKILF